jgi:hypothetical protein
MAIVLTASTDWRARAQERHRASAERDPAVKKWLEGVAKEYERLAEFTAGRRRNANQQENKENT